MGRGLRQTGARRHFAGLIAVDALIKMIRDEPARPGGPIKADVHPDEVPNFRAGGWAVAPAADDSGDAETPFMDGGGGGGADSDSGSDACNDPADPADPADPVLPTERRSRGRPRKPKTSDPQ